MLQNFNFPLLLSSSCYISSQSTTLSSLLNIPSIPQLSSYHLINIDAEIGLFINQGEIIKKYCQVMKGMKKRDLVIQVAMPLRIKGKVFGGRWVLWRGKVVMVKLNTCPIKITYNIHSTTSKEKHIQYHPWQRYKLQQLIPQSLSPQTKALLQPYLSKTVYIGDFYISFLNIRIGILFEEQIQQLMDDYLQLGFDLVTIFNGNSSSKNREIIKAAVDGVRKKSFVVEVEPEGCMNMDYYDFTKMFKNRTYDQQQTSAFNKLTSLQLPIYLSQKMIPKNNHSQTISSKAYSSNSLPHSSIKTIDKIISRLQSLTKLSNNGIIYVFFGDNFQELEEAALESIFQEGQKRDILWKIKRIEKETILEVIECGQNESIVIVCGVQNQSIQRMCNKISINSKNNKITSNFDQKQILIKYFQPKIILTSLYTFQQLHEIILFKPNLKSKIKPEKLEDLQNLAKQINEEQEKGVLEIEQLWKKNKQKRKDLQRDYLELNNKVFGRIGLNLLEISLDSFEKCCKLLFYIPAICIRLHKDEK